MLEWAEHAGSPAKRCLAALALERGFTPTKLAAKVRRDQGWIGRWFRREGDGDGHLLEKVCKALGTSGQPILDLFERKLLDDLKTNLERYPDPQSFARQVRSKLSSCRPETRARVLAEYALRCARQQDGLSIAVRALAHASAAVGTAGYEARAEAVPEPVPYHAASEAAAEKLAGLASFQVPLRPVRQPQELARALLMHAECLRKFVRSGEQTFSEKDVSHSVTDLLKALAKKGWPGAMLDAARQHYDRYYSEGL